MNPRNPIGIPRETSALLPSRDSTSPAHLWKSVAQGGETLSALVNSQSLANAKLNGIGGNTQASMDFHPWKVYPYVRGTISAADELALGITDETIGRTFRVRSGALDYNPPKMTANEFGGFQHTYNEGSAIGCDLTRWFNTGLIPLAADDLGNGYPYDHSQFDNYKRSIFVLPLNKISYFYIAHNGGSGVNRLCVTDDPKNAAPPDGVPFKWVNFPYYHPYFYPIAWVATSTSGSTIYQMAWGNLNDNIPFHHYGTWGSRPSPDFSSLNDFGYPKGALVTKARGPYKTAAYYSADNGNKTNPDLGGWIRLGEYMTTQVDPGPVANLSIAGLPTQADINTAIVNKINEILNNLRAQKVITP